MNAGRSLFEDAVGICADAGLAVARSLTQYSRSVAALSLFKLVLIAVPCRDDEDGYVL